jgi:hypothetical protein
MLREVPITPVDRFELAAIDSDQRIAKQVQAPAQKHKLPAHPPDRLAIVAPEVRNRLEVRAQPPRQPDQFHITLGLAFQAAAGLYAVQIPVDVELQQRRGVIRGSTGRLGLCALKTHILQIQLINEYIDNPDRVVLSDVIVQHFGKQRALGSVLAHHVSLHGTLARLRCCYFIECSDQAIRFHTT